ncbi:MAG TPA: protein translocase subunit SecD [Lachnospiraceae bacterium]|nr:protein translocase subunit SecD [Lachnospiraceae bacterium]
MKKGKSVVSLILLAVVAAALAVGAKLSVGKIKLGLDLNGGAAIVYQAEKEDVTEDEMKSAVSLIQRRLDRKGWTEGEASMQGSNRIRVEIPGIEDAETAVTELGQTAQLLFVDENGKTLLTGADVADAQMNVSSSTKDGPSQPCVSLEFTEEGKALFAQATEENLNKRIAIVMDDQIISAPTVNSKITDGKAMITGQFTSDEATEMAIRIKEGSLPFNLSVIEMNNVGARLGANAVVTSLKAAAVGIALVLLFMLIAYMACGFAADWALVIYMGLEIIAISVFGVTLTLPGIAGIILSVGMAVDANVIIFERIKEEVAIGKTLRTAVDNGFSRALPAILDGNITTFIAAVVLFFMGTGTIRGFAQTLMIGIVISMFTAIVITRLIMKSIIGIGISKPELFGIKKVEKA